MKYTYDCNKFQVFGIKNINESLSVHYLVYKITNNINGKYYIGQHITENLYDDYLGSGRLINKAKEKYQLSSFTKEILFDYDNFEDMNNKEAELVQLSNCFPNDKMSYNLRLGGNQGQLTKEHKEKISKARIKYFKNMTNEEKRQLNLQKKLEQDSRTEEEKQQMIEKCRKASSGKNNPMYGKSIFDYMSEEKIKKWKKKRSELSKGKNNPMYGKDWREGKTQEELQAHSNKIKIALQKNGHPCQDTKMLYDLEGKRRYIKIEKIDEYLKLGWKQSKIQEKKDKIEKTKKSTYGKKWMFNKKLNKRIYINQEDVQKYIKLGYILGTGKCV